MSLRIDVTRLNIKRESPVAFFKLSEKPEGNAVKNMDKQRCYWPTRMFACQLVLFHQMKLCELR